jgi:hypothetical protein
MVRVRIPTKYHNQLINNFLVLFYTFLSAPEIPEVKRRTIIIKVKFEMSWIQTFFFSERSYIVLNLTVGTESIDTTIMHIGGHPIEMAV